jgi:hypothetical protein
MTTMMYQTIANGEVWYGKIKNRAKDVSFCRPYANLARFLNSEGETRYFLAIRADTSQDTVPLSPAFRFCGVTHSRAASRDLSRRLGEPKSSSHFESIRDSSPAILFGMDSAA